MLRTLRVPARTRDILKWEGIVNDPIGALLGAAIYAYITYAGVSRDAVAIGFDIAAAAAIATGLGVALGYAVTTLFPRRSEEHTSELQSLMRISYAVFCLKKKTTRNKNHHN